MSNAVDELSRPGILLERTRHLAAIVDEGTHFVHFRAKTSVLAAGLAVGGDDGRQPGGVREQAQCESSGRGWHENVYRCIPLPLLRLRRSGRNER